MIAGLAEQQIGDIIVEVLDSVAVIGNARTRVGKGLFFRHDVSLLGLFMANLGHNIRRRFGNCTHTATCETVILVKN